MPDETPGRVAATLSAIRERAEQAAPALAARRGLNSMADSAEDVPVLLAAVDAALKRHYPVRVGIVTVCASCMRMEGRWRRQAWPCEEYADITAALTGTQPSEDGNHG